MGDTIDISQERIVHISYQGNTGGNEIHAAKNAKFSLLTDRNVCVNQIR